ncbi:proteoglycan 4-like isoform X1 [Neodiprion virginianus]|uniref:proteoglycan 4-like isoform X1 n=1 Tax=Neodiprion virginianus TaxID=2961670 RepID=UPI001EE6F087|nr:proteoglycan 4-like isoform X1 [Neodiprion virginianus]
MTNRLLCSKMTPWLIAIFCLVTASCTNPMDQQTSETSNDQQVAILKQIRKVNEDGSYTFGYEAGDGSFKVESRDVLGNIKGTFGFVDAEGEIKRVSYSSSNGTGFKATTVPPLQEQVSVVQSIPRLNLTSTSTRKPNVVYATEASARSSVVQTIPRLRKTTTTSTTTTSTTTTTEPPSSRPTYNGHYIRSSSSRNRPRFSPHQRPAPLVVEEDTEAEDEDSQITRPVVEDKRAPVHRRIIFAKRPIESSHSLRPITEEFEDQEDEVKITTGNTLRRQLNEDTTKTDSATEEAVDEHGDVYGGALSLSRPLFTTSTPPRVAQRIAGSRAERPKTIYVNQNNLGPARFEPNTKYEGLSAYETREKDLQDQERNAQPQQQVLFRAPVQPSRDYARQSSEPVYVREHPDQQQYLREVPPEGIIVEARRVPEDEDAAPYRQLPLSRIIFRPLPNQLFPDAQEQSQPRYLGEPTAPEQGPKPRVHVGPNFLRPLMRPVPRPLPYPEDDQQSPIDETDYSPVQDYPYRAQNVAPPPEPLQPITPPLSRRDFQILLRRLLISQYGARALAHPRTYLEDALYDQQTFPTYRNDYQAPVPRQNLFRNGFEQAPQPNQYGERLAVHPASGRRPGLSRILNPAYQPGRYEDYQEPAAGYGKRVYRQKFYAQEAESPGNDEEVLPPPVREALLLRMLQLAINPDRPVMVPGVMAAATPAPNPYRYRKMGPVRSVQIITDDSEEEKELGQGKGGM